MNLVPNQAGRSPNYWCTWNAQHPMWYIRSEEELATFDFYKATEGGTAARKRMNQAALFEVPGWAVHFWKKERGDLYLCLDDGWDVPADINASRERWRFGSLILNEERFPDFQGDPAQRLRTLNARIKDLGWRGLALWVAAQCAGENQDQKGDAKACENYWRERLRWSAQAGIEYWKVDWGERCCDPAFRRMLTEVAREEAPGLLVEHARCMGPVNNVPGSGRFADADASLVEQSTEILGFSDVFRTYDAVGEIEIPVTLDRIRYWMNRVQMAPAAKGILNCEDAVYLGAAMGFSFGVMRVPVRNPYTHWRWLRIDEASRAIRWQRIAPAFGLVGGNLCVSERELTDSMTMSSDFWDRSIAGKLIEQHAPAVMSRGMALPKVACCGEPPFVVASKNPSRAVAVATLPRCLNGKREHPLADVQIDVDGLAHPIGVFGRFRTLTIHVRQSLAGARCWLQDLLTDTAADVTARVRYAGNAVILDGTLIDEAGRSAATTQDPSDPGLILKMMN